MSSRSIINKAPQSTTAPSTKNIIAANMANNITTPFGSINLVFLTVLTFRRRFTVKVIVIKVILAAITDEDKREVSKNRNTVINPAPANPPILNCA